MKKLRETSELKNPVFDIDKEVSLFESKKAEMSLIGISA